MTAKADSTKIADDIIQEEKDGVSATPQQVQVLSSQDTEVCDLVAEAPKSVDSLSVTDNMTFANLLELPEECKPLHKVRYRFRWLAKDRNLSARIRSSVWELCTRTNAPFIKSHRFKSHGAVEQAGMLLAFCPEDVGKWREEQPANKSAALVKHYTEDLPRDEAKGFYKPENSGDDSEEGLTEDKDF